MVFQKMGPHIDGDIPIGGNVGSADMTTPRAL